MKTSLSKTVLIATLVAAAGGCALPVKRPAESPYLAHYAAAFADAGMPAADEIEAAGVSWTLPGSPAEVWHSVLAVTQQYEGIVRYRADERAGDYTLVVVHGAAIPYKSPSVGFHRNKLMVVNKFLDTWLAIRATPAPGSGDATVVTAAWLEPESLQPVRPSAASDEFGGDLIGNDRLSTFDSITSALRRNDRALASSAASSKGEEERWQYVPAQTINAFFFELTTQLLGPPRWVAKMGSIDRAPERQLSFERVDDEALNEHRELMQTAGNWTSASLRRNSAIVHAPVVTGMLADLVDRIKRASGDQDVATDVFVIASPQINAFAVPNGDIFVTSGLLENVSSIHELAMVVGHEMDHLLQRDTVARLINAQKAGKRQQTWMIAGAVAGGVGGAFVTAGGTAIGAVPSLSTQITSNVVANTITTAASVAGQSLSASMIAGHSKDAELRADRNGARYVHAAGLDVSAGTTVLGRLYRARVQAEEEKDTVTIASGFINAEPGLEKRIEQMEAQVVELRGDDDERR